MDEFVCLRIECKILNIFSYIISMGLSLTQQHWCTNGNRFWCQRSWNTLCARLIYRMHLVHAYFCSILCSCILLLNTLFMHTSAQYFVHAYFCSILCSCILLLNTLFMHTSAQYFVHAYFCSILWAKTAVFVHFWTLFLLKNAVDITTYWHQTTTMYCVTALLYFSQKQLPGNIARARYDN